MLEPMAMSEIGLRKDFSKIKKIVPRYSEVNPIREFLDTRLLDIDGVFLAGAALQSIIVNGVEIKDYDVFFTQKGLLKVAEATLKAQGFTCTGFEDSDKMVTYSNGNIDVQLINVLQYSSPEECIRSFDFTCTMLALDKTGLYYTLKGVSDIVNKELNINVLNYPADTLARLHRYITVKGYSISFEEENKIIGAVEESEGPSFFYEGDERYHEYKLMMDERLKRGIDLGTKIQSY